MSVSRLLAVAATISILSLTLASPEARAQSTSVVLPSSFPRTDVEVIDIKRGDGGTTVTVHGVVHNRSDHSVTIGYVSDIYLADFKNRRKYLVIHDSAGTCFCSTGPQLAVEAGADGRFWAKFPAPPEAINALSFGWGAIEPGLVPVTN
jgi:hypothetical protein